MTSVTAIGVDDEEYVVPNPTDRLDSDPPYSPRSSGLSSVGAIDRFCRSITW
jgi:hypothetical protein